MSKRKSASFGVGQKIRGNGFQEIPKGSAILCSLILRTLVLISTYPLTPLIRNYEVEVKCKIIKFWVHGVGDFVLLKTSKGMSYMGAFKWEMMLRISPQSK